MRSPPGAVTHARSSGRSSCQGAHDMPISELRSRPRWVAIRFVARHVELLRWAASKETRSSDASSSTSRGPSSRCAAGPPRTAGSPGAGVGPRQLTRRSAKAARTTDPVDHDMGRDVAVAQSQTQRGAHGRTRACEGPRAAHPSRRCAGPGPACTPTAMVTPRRCGFTARPAAQSASVLSPHAPPAAPTPAPARAAPPDPGRACRQWGAPPAPRRLGPSRLWRRR